MKAIIQFHLLLTFLFLLLAFRVEAQKIWTLQDCVDHAIEHNLQAKDRRFQSASLEEEKKQSVRAMLPTIQAFSSYSISYGRSVDPNTNAVVSNDFFFNNYGLDADISLFQGFQKHHHKAAVRFIYQATLKGNEQEEYLLAFRVMNSFYDVVFYKGALKNAKDQILISETNKVFIEKQIEVGLIPGSDIHLAESVLIGDQLQVLSAENNLHAARLRLSHEMNLPNQSDELSLVHDENSLPIVTGHYILDSMYSNAQGLPVIEAQEFRIQSATSRLKQSRGLLSPSLSAFAGYGTGYFETNVDADQNVIPFDRQIKDNASQYIGVSLNIPILDGWTRRSQVNQRKIDLLREMNTLEIQKQQVKQTIQEAYAAQRAATSEYEMSTENVASLQIAFDIAQKKYEKGLFSSLDLYRAKSLLSQAQNATLQLKMKSIMLSKTLDFYAGIQVFNFSTSK